MLTLLASLHILIGLCLILFVLLQDPKGGAMGVFSGGGSSNTFFGSSGASNFLTTTTKWLAVLFAASCLTLTYITPRQKRRQRDGQSASPAQRRRRGPRMFRLPHRPRPQLRTAQLPKKPRLWRFWRQQTVKLCAQ